MSQQRSRAVRALALTGLLLGSLSFSALLGEVGLRLAGYGTLYDVYTISSYLWQRDPLLGWSHEPNARGTFIGPRPFPIEYETPIEINSLGLRGPEVAPKQRSEYRVMLLGDSVTVGFEVAYERTFGALLERELERRLRVPVTVINAAVRGYGTDQSYLYYRERGHALHPDLVMLVHSNNDAMDNMTLHRIRKPMGKPALALQPDGTLVRVELPTSPYPVCSAWMLDENFEPRRSDGLLNRLTCQLQTQLSHHSALFSVVASLLARMPGVVHFLKNLTYPQEQVDTQHSRESSFPGFIEAARAGATRTLAEAKRELSTALIIQLAKEVAARGQRFALVAGKSVRGGLELDALREAGVEIPDYRLQLLPSSSIHFRNDGHLNAAGHYRLAEGLVPVIAGYAMEQRPELRQTIPSRRRKPAKTPRELRRMTR